MIRDNVSPDFTIGMCCLKSCYVPEQGDGMLHCQPAHFKLNIDIRRCGMGQLSIKVTISGSLLTRTSNQLLLHETSHRSIIIKKKKDVA